MSYGQGDLTPGGFGSGSEQSSYQNDVPKNDFPRLTRVVSSNIQKIQQNTNDITRMVEQLGSPTDSSDLRDRLSQRIHYTNQLAKDTARFLKNIKDMPPAYPSSEQRHRKTQIERLTGDFSDSLNRFQTVQRDAAAREKETLARVRAASASQDRAGDALIDISGGYSFHPNSRMQTQEQSQVSEAELQEIEERQAAIQQLEARYRHIYNNYFVHTMLGLNGYLRRQQNFIQEMKRDIIDVNEIFRDLSQMVEAQGEVIDSIEAGVESAAENVTSGNQQLTKARASASSLRKKKFLCAILGLVLVAVLVIIIYFSVPKSN